MKITSKSYLLRSNMSYTHLTKTELIFIEEYVAIGLKGRQIAQKLQRGHEAIYRVIRQLKAGKTAIDIYLTYKLNKNVAERSSSFLKTKLITLMRK